MMYFCPWRLLLTDSDELQQYAAFHLGLHYLPTYPFMEFSVYKEFR